MTEQQLMWKTVYEEHGPAIFGFLASRLGNRQDAEDLLQETFVRAIRATDSIRDHGKIRSFLFTVAHNTMINHLRKHRERSLVPDYAEYGNQDDDVLDTNGLPSDASANINILEEHLGRVLDGMPAAHSKAFKLGILEQRPYSEIARITGWSLAQVKINVYRARKKAIEELKDEWYQD